MISLEGALDFDSVATRPGGRALPAEQRGEPGWGEGPVGGGGSGYWGYALLHSTPSASARALAWCRLIALEPAVTYRYDLSSDDLVTVDGVCWAPFELRDDPR